MPRQLQSRRAPRHHHSYQTAQIGTSNPTLLLNRRRRTQLMPPSLAHLTAARREMRKIVAVPLRSKRLKQRGGRPSRFWSAKWRWRDNVSRNGRKGKRRPLRLSRREGPRRGWTGSAEALVANGMSINGLGTQGVMARIEARRVLGLEEGKLSDHDHHHRDDRSRGFASLGWNGMRLVGVKARR
jgi:hypothetical protein